ncbi:MAG: hypothetical protein GY853_03710 [PVC group bacterium]|nr:hypothetical protein [PVC group bacterium]
MFHRKENRSFSKLIAFILIQAFVLVNAPIIYAGGLFDRSAQDIACLSPQMHLGASALQQAFTVEPEIGPSNDKTINLDVLNQLLDSVELDENLLAMETYLRKFLSHDDIKTDTKSCIEMLKKRGLLSPVSETTVENLARAMKRGITRQADLFRDDIVDKSKSYVRAEQTTLRTRLATLNYLNNNAKDAELNLINAYRWTQGDNTILNNIYNVLQKAALVSIEVGALWEKMLLEDDGDKADAFQQITEIITSQEVAKANQLLIKEIDTDCENNRVDNARTKLTQLLTKQELSLYGKKTLVEIISDKLSLSEEQHTQVVEMSEDEISDADIVESIIINRLSNKLNNLNKSLEINLKGRMFDAALADMKSIEDIGVLGFEEMSEFRDAQVLMDSVLFKEAKFWADTSLISFSQGDKSEANTSLKNMLEIYAHEATVLETRGAIFNELKYKKMVTDDDSEFFTDLENANDASSRENSIKVIVAAIEKNIEPGIEILADNAKSSVYGDSTRDDEYLTSEQKTELLRAKTDYLRETIINAVSRAYDKADVAEGSLYMQQLVDLTAENKTDAEFVEQTANLIINTWFGGSARYKGRVMSFFNESNTSEITKLINDQVIPSKAETIISLVKWGYDRGDIKTAEEYLTEVLMLSISAGVTQSSRMQIITSLRINGLVRDSLNPILTSDLEAAVNAEDKAKSIENIVAYLTVNIGLNTVREDVPQMRRYLRKLQTIDAGNSLLVLLNSFFAKGVSAERQKELVDMLVAEEVISENEKDARLNELTKAIGKSEKVYEIRDIILKQGILVEMAGQISLANWLYEQLEADKAGSFLKLVLDICDVTPTLGKDIFALLSAVGLENADDTQRENLYQILSKDDTLKNEIIETINYNQQIEKAERLMRLISLRAADKNDIGGKQMFKEIKRLLKIYCDEGSSERLKKNIFALTSRLSNLNMRALLGSIFSSVSKKIESEKAPTEQVLSIVGQAI